VYRVATSRDSILFERFLAASIVLFVAFYPILLRRWPSLSFEIHPAISATLKLIFFDVNRLPSFSFCPLPTIVPCLAPILYPSSPSPPVTTFRYPSVFPNSDPTRLLLSLSPAPIIILAFGILIYYPGVQHSQHILLSFLSSFSPSTSVMATQPSHCRYPGCSSCAGLFSGVTMLSGPDLRSLFRRISGVIEG